MTSNSDNRPTSIPKSGPAVLKLGKVVLLLGTVVAAFVFGALLAFNSGFGRKEVYRKQLGEETFVVSFDFQGTLTVQALPPAWKLMFRDYNGPREFTDLILTPEGIYELRCDDGTKIRFTRPAVTSPRIAH